MPPRPSAGSKAGGILSGASRLRYVTSAGRGTVGLDAGALAAVLAAVDRAVDEVAAETLAVAAEMGARTADASHAKEAVRRLWGDAAEGSDAKAASGGQWRRKRRAIDCLAEDGPAAQRAWKRPATKVGGVSLALHAQHRPDSADNDAEPALRRDRRSSNL